jgi:sugar phosphate isomerase/epimerase
MGGDVGVTVSTEAHLGSVVPSPAKAAALLAKAPGLTLTLDYGHFIYQGFKNDEIHPLIPHASHFHARAGANKQLQPVLKENEIDFLTILRRMKRSAYRGYLGIEYVWIDWEGCNRVDNLSETIQLRDLLRSVKP